MAKKTKKTYKGEYQRGLRDGRIQLQYELQMLLGVFKAEALTWDFKHKATTKNTKAIYPP